MRVTEDSLETASTAQVTDEVNRKPSLKVGKAAKRYPNATKTAVISRTLDVDVNSNDYYFSNCNAKVLFVDNQKQNLMDIIYQLSNKM